MTAKILIDSYANVRVSPTFLKTWGPENGFEILGFAAYLWGSDNALCGVANPPAVQAITHTWLEELTAAGMGLFGNLELGANDPDVLGAQGGIDQATLAVDATEHYMLLLVLPSASAMMPSSPTGPTSLPSTQKLTASSGLPGTSLSSTASPRSTRR